MSMMSSLLLARAVATGQAQRRRQYRHVHLLDAPLLVTTTFLAGEPAGCFAIAARRFGCQPDLWVIPEPRDRDLRDAGLKPFYSWLAARIEEDRAASRGTQLIVPGPAEADALARLGRLHRYQRQQTPLYPPEVVTGAQLLTVLTDRRDVPGSALCLDATTELQRLYVPPMSPPECAHLGALIAAIDPPLGMRAQDAALAAERTSMGLIPDPAFDNDQLAPAIEAFNEARKGPAPDCRSAQRHEKQLAAFGKQLICPKLDALNHAVGLLKAVPEAPSAAQRFYGKDRGSDWALPADAKTFARKVGQIRSGKATFKLKQTHGQQAAWLTEAETIRQVAEAREVYEDPFAFAEAVAEGKAWTGVVMGSEVRTIRPNGKNEVKRTRVTARSHWPMLFAPGTQLHWADNPRCALEIVHVEPAEHGTEVTFEVVKGMRDHWPTAAPAELRVAEASPVAAPRPPEVDPTCWKDEDA